MSNLLDLPSGLAPEAERWCDYAGPGEFLIFGITAEGKPVRPGDWRERLCGVVAPFRPGRTVPRSARAGYSPFARPVRVDGVACVRIDPRLRVVEPMALVFVLNFVRDNTLRVLRPSGAA